MSTSLSIEDPEILVSPTAMLMARVTVSMKTVDGKNITLTLKEIFKKIETKYKGMTKEEYTAHLEPTSLVASYMLASLGLPSHDQLIMMGFVKGFIIGQVFGKNNMIIDVEKEPIEESEYRKYVAKRITLSAERAISLAQKIRDGEEDIKLLEATFFGE